MTPDEVLAAIFILGILFLFIFLNGPTPQHNVIRVYPEPVHRNQWYAAGAQHRRHSPPTFHYPQPSARSFEFNKTSRNSSPLNFTYGDLDRNQVFREEKGIPVVDLHNLTQYEAIRIVNEFLSEKTGRFSRVRIVTGRGLHSQDGVAKVKPAIQQLLDEKRLSYRDVSRGGCLEVTLPVSYFY